MVTRSHRENGTFVCQNIQHIKDYIDYSTFPGEFTGKKKDNELKQMR